MARSFKSVVSIDDQASASSEALRLKVTGEANARLSIDAGGKLTWGSGSASGDATLYRSAANALKTDDTFQAALGVITLTTDGAPSSSLADGAVAVDTTNDSLYFRSSSNWQAISNLIISDGVPSGPVAGDLWFESDTGRTFVYYADGSSNQWVEVGSASSSGVHGAAGKVQFSEGNTFASDTLLHWDNSNNRLGVGTASPGYPLETGGDVRIGGGGDVRLSDSSATGTTANDTILYNDAETLSFWVNGAVRSKILSDGKVGIGEVAPASDLVVRADSAAGRGGEITILNYATSTVGNEAALNFGLENSTYAGDAGNAQIKARLNATSGAADLIFSNWTGGAFTEHMRIMADGKVGIGDSSPSYKLEVAGTFRAVGDHDDNVLLESTGTGLGIIASHTGSGTPVPWDIREDSSTDHNSASYAPLYVSRLNVTADGAGSNLQFRTKKNDGTAQEVGGLGATIDTGLTASATVTGSLHFYTTDAGTQRTEQMTIKSDGKVGIGTTAPPAKLSIDTSATRGGYSNLALGAGGNNPQMEFYNANTSWAISHYDNDRIQIASYYGGAWVEARGITIRDANGYVGIGTTTPTAKLSVTSGNTSFSALFGKHDDEGLFLHSDASSSHYNWRITTQTEVDTGFEIAASTAVGGTTWADPTFVIKQNGGVVIDGNAGIGSLTLKGDGSGYTHSHILIECEDASRGGGMYCYNSADDVNWFVGMPYGIADSFSINHKDNASFDVSTADDGYCTFQIREAATAHGGTHQEYGGVGFAAASVWIDRNWGNYPGITVCNTTIAGGTTQGEFRIHGANHTWASYPATSGSDFGCSLRIDGSYIPSSDGRSKTNIENITGALASVTAMQGVAFNRKTREGETETLERHVGGKRYGFIAQDAKDHVPHATVYYADEDTPLDNGWCNSYSFDYGGLTAVLVEAIKELTTRLEALEAA